MKTYGRRLSLVGLVGLANLLVAGAALGQVPRVNYVMPMGGKAGSTFEFVVTGQDMQGVSGLYFSFPGAKVEVEGSEAFKPVVDPKPPKKAPPPPKGQISQRFKVTLPADTPLGIHDVRLVTANGMSNPRAFVVSDLQEFAEQEPNDDLPKAQKIAVNSAVSGVVSVGTDVDYYQFTGKKGQRVIVSCQSTSIDSKLPAFVELYSISGTSLGSNKGYQNNDALVDAVLPDDGDYYVRVSSFTYTLGGPDYFYRLAVSTAPWIDAVSPQAIEPGKEAKVTVYGRNLPGGVAAPASMHEGRVLEKVVVTVKAPMDRDARTLRSFQPPLSAAVTGFTFTMKNDSGTSNPFFMALASAPVTLKAGGNDGDAKAQKVTVPCEIAGQFDKKGSRDWYTFSAKKGQVFTIDAYGERIGSPVDLFYALYNGVGTLITEQDENIDITANQLYTRTDDPPTYRLSVPADGDYKIMISNKFGNVQFGPRYGYVLRIVPEAPDFTLVAMPLSQLNPDSVVVNQSSSQVYSVYVFRQGGFTGDITLSGDKLPPGLKIAPQIIAGNQKVANLVVSAAADAPAFAGGISVVGTSTVDGAKIVRQVRAATITWPVVQAAPTISRLDRELTLSVRDKAPYILSVDSDSLTFTQGEKITVNVKVKRQDNFKQAVNVIALNLPANLVQQPLSLAAGTDTGKLTLDYKGGALPAGSKLTLVLRGQTQAPNPKNVQPKGPPEASNLLQACSPITVTIVAKGAKTGRLELPLDVDNVRSVSAR